MKTTSAVLFLIVIVLGHIWINTRHTTEECTVTHAPITSQTITPCQCCPDSAYQLTFVPLGCDSILGKPMATTPYELVYKTETLKSKLP
jgi:hypothetical protein